MQLACFASKLKLAPKIARGIFLQHVCMRKISQSIHNHDAALCNDLTGAHSIIGCPGPPQQIVIMLQEHQCLNASNYNKHSLPIVIAYCYRCLLYKKATLNNMVTTSEIVLLIYFANIHKPQLRNNNTK